MKYPNKEPIVIRTVYEDTSQTGTRVLKLGALIPYNNLVRNQTDD